MPMHVMVFGENKTFLEKALIKEGFGLSYHPKIIIVLGGDGRLLEAERLFPGIPKLLVKHSLDCKDCAKHDYAKVVKLLKGKLKVKEYFKLEAKVKGKSVWALNEIDIHNNIPSALRFGIAVNGKILNNEIIGDGVVISTPFGSSGYHYSIAKKSFAKGLGLAFNNVFCSDKKAAHRIVGENAVVRVRIIRGPGFVVNDNNNQMLNVHDDDVIEVRKSGQKAKIILAEGKYYLSFRKKS